METIKTLIWYVGMTTVCLVQVPFWIAAKLRGEKYQWKGGPQ